MTSQHYTNQKQTCFSSQVKEQAMGFAVRVRSAGQKYGQRATKGTVLTSQNLSPWCDCRCLGSTWASWRWQDINVGNLLWRQGLFSFSEKMIFFSPVCTEPFFFTKNHSTPHISSGPPLSMGWWWCGVGWTDKCTRPFPWDTDVYWTRTKQACREARALSPILTELSWTEPTATTWHFLIILLDNEY